MQQGDRVAYVGKDDPDLLLWHGQPGRVSGTDLWPHEATVSFVNGPSLCLAPADIAALDDATYAERARRVLVCAHPTVAGRRIPQFWAELEPWEDDHVARAAGGSEPARETAESYDRIVDSYEAQAAQPPPGRTAFLVRFIDRVRHHGRVLDAGCGPGQDLDALAARGLTALGLDASLGMARRARSRGHAVVAADLRRPPFGPAVLDGMWSAASLLHVPRPDVAPTLVAWQRLLRPGGVLGLITSLGDDEGWEAVPYQPGSQHVGVALRRWFVHHDREALIRSLSEAGLHVEHAEERQGHRRWLQLLARKDG